MALVSVATVLADSVNPLSGLSGAGFTGARIALSIILLIVIGIPSYLIITSFPMWLAAKIAVSGETTFGSAVKVVIGHFLAGALTYAVGFVMLFLGGTLGGPRGVFIILGLLSLVWIISCLSITGNTYGIDLLHAFGLQLLSGLMVVLVGAVIFFGFSMVVGMAGAMAPLQASYQKIQQVQAAGKLPSFHSSEPASAPEADAMPAPAPAFTPPPDYTVEIDGLLNAALHPTGPAPSLTEREDLVRILQQRLQAQRGGLQPGDTRAATIYQNQLNRYLLLLDQVKLERKAHPLRDTAANP
ncbi:MAG TPA: hypothetical protein VK961_12495 [Chthoniobacter sp.]|nr:hypothetical protein [Chthoniobacter sp.]